ncbi:MAG: DUF4214 domain-containing protein [Acidimicrobiia bacterium]
MQSTTGGRRRAAARAVAATLVAISLLVGAGAGAPAAGAQTASDVVYDGTPDGIDGSVYRLYRAFFLREPDSDGLLHWIIHARWFGYPLGAVAQDFASSPEFRARYGALDDGGFVDLVYRNVLRRSPDPGGRAFWLDHLRRGMPRGHLMLHFSDSVEFGRSAGAGPFGRRDFRGPAEAAPAAPAGSWAYLDPTGDAGRPVGWARCRPVYVAANPAGIPTSEHGEFEAMVRHALDAISTATGQDWVLVGRTAWRAADHRSARRMLGVVTISFMTAPDPNDTAAAWATNAYGRNPLTGTTTYLTGDVNLNAQRLVGDLGGEVTPLVATTLMHELGHIAGLDHVLDRTQLMSDVYEMPPEPRYEVYRDGDRAGLARVGSVTVPC